MRFIVMHRTNAHWEAGAIPTPVNESKELIGGYVIIGADAAGGRRMGAALRGRGGLSRGRRPSAGRPLLRRSSRHASAGAVVSRRAAWVGRRKSGAGTTWRTGVASIRRRRT
jgi:hypothetical protein